jgi:hypothetical protein
MGSWFDNSGAGHSLATIKQQRDSAAHDKAFIADEQAASIVQAAFA